MGQILRRWKTKHLYQVKEIFQRKLKPIKPDHDYEIRRPRRAISGTYSYPNPLKAYDFSNFTSEYLN